MEKEMVGEMSEKDKIMKEARRKDIENCYYIGR